MVSAKFVEGVSGKLAERWVATLLTPAFCFWAGGFYAWVQRCGWASFKAQLGLLSTAYQIAVLVVSLLVVSVSAFVIRHFDLSILRLLEGYWPRCLKPLMWLRRRLIKRQKKHIPEQEHLQDLIRQIEAPVAISERMEEQKREQIEEKALLEYQRHRFPSPEYLMPTTLGNILRASERRPVQKYGLDAVVCWPHLWLLLPEQVRSDIQDARANLNTAARIWFWGILFALVWTPLALWALPIGLVTAWFAYRWSLMAARIYGDLVEAAFDLYRTQLYTALRWPLPTKSEEEKEQGERLTEYLWRGPVRPVTFHVNSPD